MFLKLIFQDCYKILKENLIDSFFVIPLGDENRFRIREYEVDVTHVTKKDEEWWVNMFSSQGLKLKKFSYSMGSMKRKWIDQYPYGNGFFTLES